MEIGRGQNTIANDQGEYLLDLAKGTHFIRIAYVGYASQTIEIDVQGADVRNIQLQQNLNQLMEVSVVGSTKATDISSPQMSQNRLTINEISKIPAIFGEVDPLKAILQLPGVTNAGEGSSGFNVRGGSSDQNLVLLDEAPIFTSSHLLGLFSVFNPDIIENLTLYKGGIPARYGGRVSSVLDVKTRIMTAPKFELNGGIGLITSRLTTIVPFSKDKGAILLSGRSSYAHLFLKATGNENIAYFYDLNAKVNYSFGENNRVSLSAYLGSDALGISDNFINDYGNTFINGNWEHKFSKKLISTLTLLYSGYDFRLRINPIGLDWTAGINSTKFQYDIVQQASQRLKLSYGLSSVYYQIKPGEIVPFGDRSPVNALKLIDKNSFETSAYIQAEQELSPGLNLSYGVRISSFLRMGGRDLNLYESAPVVYDKQLGIYNSAQPNAVQRFAKNKIVDKFIYPEPRLALSVQLNERESIKLSYHRIVQYLHLISNTNSPTPVDVWTPSDRYFKPQIADQLGLGYFRNLDNNQYSLEVETYFKKVQNRLDYIDGANLVGNDALEQVILSGKSRAYGLEVLFRKNYGKLTGWLSYTLSRTEQQTRGANSDEPGINNGNWYLTNFDKPHNLSLTSFYKLNDKLSIGATFTYQTGRPTSYPVGKFDYAGIQIPIYGARNAYRLPDFHHLDLSLSYIPNPKSIKRIRGEWVLSIYNLYNRKNTSSVNFGQNGDTYQSESIRLSIFGIVPAITYNFKFK
ncbi:collagen-binding protein [Pedobacter mendelii]|uniref:isocitrate dehydrogenase (NADP(+)) n=1 Tax=Pedobacter mendelii TaxID=1908240 RepID=A0ABQ2BNV7_9SPHI|nr:collagen-binding protein [Pedobacter mendelii]